MGSRGDLRNFGRRRRNVPECGSRRFTNRSLTKSWGRLRNWKRRETIDEIKWLFIYVGGFTLPRPPAPPLRVGEGAASCGGGKQVGGGVITPFFFFSYPFASPSGRYSPHKRRIVGPQHL